MYRSAILLAVTFVAMAAPARAGEPKKDALGDPLPFGTLPLPRSYVRSKRVD
jgi:hypothetical protein